MTVTEPDVPGIDPAAHAQVVLDNALLRAGVNLDTDQGQLVAAAWAGRAPDVEAIKRQWELVKPTPPVEEPAPAPGPELSAAELSQAADRQALASGGLVEPDPGDLDPMDESIRLGWGVLNPEPGTRQRAGTNEDAVATAFHTRAVAASNGDGRVLVNDNA